MTSTGANQVAPRSRYPRPLAAPAIREGSPLGAALTEGQADQLGPVVRTPTVAAEAVLVQKGPAGRGVDTPAATIHSGMGSSKLGTRPSLLRAAEEWNQDPARQPRSGWPSCTGSETG